MAAVHRSFTSFQMFHTHTFFHIVVVVVVAAYFYTGISKAKNRSYFFNSVVFSCFLKRLGPKKRRKYVVFLTPSKPKTTVFTVICSW